ncbi:MAG: hypothetical protein GC160_25525 [Acidobacteria bacterium]|nr:hypothetical protein [Acidobacteriota bacterium]
MTEASPGQARKSTLLVGVVFLAIAAWNYYRDRPALWMGFGAAAGLLLLTGLLFPAGARAFHAAWMRLAGVLGAINSRIILSAAFYLALAPLGFLTRLFGRDPLDRRGPARDSYWIPREKTRQTKEGFERLF